MKIWVFAQLTALLSLGAISMAWADDGTPRNDETTYVPCPPSEGGRRAIPNVANLADQTDEIVSLMDFGDQGSLQYIPGTSQKVCQLIGDIDYETGKPTSSQTISRAGVAGTDLGFSFQHNGKLYFLFGDTKPRLGTNRVVDQDAIASSDLNIDPKNCINLSFVKDPKDGVFKPANIPGLPDLAYNVPTGGVSANGKMYVYFTTDHTEDKLMGRSVLGVSSDNGSSFKKQYDFSSDKFINVAPVKNKKKIFLFGSGKYRESDPYLSVVTEKKFGDKNSLKYFAGLNPKSNKPKWSKSEKDAKPLFEQRCVGELSTDYNATLHKWIMLYNCDNDDTAGIHMRTADHPWGPWAAPQVIFEPGRDHATCKYMHRGVYEDHTACDQLPGPIDNDGSGYGPFMIPSLTEIHGDITTIYYTMSTWNPYTVVLMKTDLKVQ